MSLLQAEVTHELQRQRPSTAIADMMAAFFRNKRAIMLGVCAFSTVLALITIFGHKSYEARMTYLVRGEGPALPTASFDEKGGDGASRFESASDMQLGTEVELLSENELHRSVVLAMRPALSGSALDKATAKLDGSLQVMVIPKTSLISVAYNGTSREEAEQTLKVLNSQYLAYRARIHGTAGAFAFFDSEANRYAAQLQADQDKLTGFRQLHQITLLAEQKSIAVHGVADTNTQLLADIASQAEAARKIARMTADRDALQPRIATQIREMPEQSSAERLNSLLVDLKNKRVELLTKFHADDRHVQELDAQIANTEDGLRQAQSTKSIEQQTDLNPVRQTVVAELEQMQFQQAGLEGRVHSLAAQYRIYDHKLQELNELTAEHDALVRNVSQDEENYTLFSRRREQAKLNQNLDKNSIANVVLVSSPMLDTTAQVQSLLGLACVLLIGILLISGGGVLAGLWSPRFHAPWEIEAAVDVPVLATIPAQGNTYSRRLRERSIAQLSSPEDATALWNSDAGPAPLAPRLAGRSLPQIAPYLQQHALSLTGVGARSHGAYLSMIEKVRRMKGAGAGAPVIVFTAATRGEGVTHVIRGLAQELTSMTSRRVAVVSASDAYHSAEAWSDSVLPQLDSGSNACNEGFLAQWIEQLRKSHDYVLIDCPSLAASHAAVAMGPLSDGVIVVVGAGKSTRIQLRGSLAALSLVSAPLLGIALNGRTYPIPDSIYKLL